MKKTTIFLLSFLFLPAPEAVSQLKSVGNFMWNGINPIARDEYHRTDYVLSSLVAANTLLHASDYITTVAYIDHSRVKEVSLLGRYYVKKPEVMIPVKVLFVVSTNNFVKVTREKGKKSISYIFTTSLVILGSLVVGNNIAVAISL